jgi:small-conductance mechanosensitive channel
MEGLNQVFWGNTLYAYIIAAGIIAIGLVVLRIVKSIVLHKLRKWAERTVNTVDDFIISLVDRAAMPMLYFSVMYGGLHYLNLPDKVSSVLRAVIVLVNTFYVLRVLTMVIEYSLISYLKKRHYADPKRSEVKGILMIINLVLWCIAIVFLLDNFGYNVTTIITSLGIGGVAIALASQNILSDLFCYFVIFFDRPFEIGDSILVGDKSGTVMEIGVKTTRIRSTSGEEMIFSNKALTDSRIHNFKRMEKRRIAFILDVVYETPAEVIEEIPALLKSIITAQEGIAFDRAHFASYGPYSLKFEVVYNVLTSDYNKYMDTQQVINFAIFREFAKRNIQFAYPTQTIFNAKD